MSEFVYPGVYVEESPVHPQSIPGVPTGTAAFVGITRYGPVFHHPLFAPARPVLLTSYADFQRVYGDAGHLASGAACHVAHAARAFFDNGGARLYVSRIFSPARGTGVASLRVPVGNRTATWTACWPGQFGNVSVAVTAVRHTVRFDETARTIAGIEHGSVLEVKSPGHPTLRSDALDLDDLRVVHVSRTGAQLFYNRHGAVIPREPAHAVHLVELNVAFRTSDGARTDSYDGLGTHPRQTRYIGRVLGPAMASATNSLVALRWRAPRDSTKPAPQPGNFAPATLLHALATKVPLAPEGTPGWAALTGGDDGQIASAAIIAGVRTDSVPSGIPSSGLAALDALHDVALVAAPDVGAFADPVEYDSAVAVLIEHAKRLQYRLAVLDAPLNATHDRVTAIRARLDSSHAALYHPWLELGDSRASPVPPFAPPCGYVCGILARDDATRGVSHSTTQDTVLGLTEDEVQRNASRLATVDAEGVNAFRYFPGRGIQLWGGRTLSSDPAWKYVAVRRLCIYLEHSIDAGTRWTVFEPNDARLWETIRQRIEDFLMAAWRDGALQGDRPSEAYFVRCDRTTMTQDDLDSGRLVCLIGVAVVRPADFVIIRIGRWTADAVPPAQC